MSNYIIIQMPAGAGLPQLANDVNCPTKKAENLNKIIDHLSGLLAGAKTGTIEIVTTSTQNTFTTTGTGSADNTYTF